MDIKNIYIIKLFLYLTQLFQLHSHGQNQLKQLREDINVTPEDLLIMPAVSSIRSLQTRSTY